MRKGLGKREKEKDVKRKREREIYLKLEKPRSFFFCVNPVDGGSKKGGLKIRGVAATARVPSEVHGGGVATYLLQQLWRKFEETRN